MTTKLRCPRCGSDLVTLTYEQKFLANTQEHYCHSVKIGDPNSKADCLECEWKGVRRDLLETDVDPT